MKKNKFMVIGFLCAGLCVLASCATTKTTSSNIKGGNKAKLGKKVYEMVDYQGASFGKAVPKWVELLSEGQYSQEVLSKEMPGLDGKKVFVVQGRGDNLDFVKSWVTLVDIETEVSGTMERVTGKAVTSQMEGTAHASGQNADPSEVNKVVNDFRMAVQNVRITGLERIADYWAEIQVTENKEIVDDYFEYYSVWVMDQKLFNSQLEQALKRIEETTDQTKELKKLVNSKLTSELSIASNSPDVVERADIYIIDNK